ncbi:unnamed protein product [Echinostoma caproni]|uniref:Abhydrolase_3 domain-containing protein n=1 Tax=Echinostoma caproni TaxID=27848 RepID=A0A183A9F0_9TREM|nr:unnamed protein product [Echinostoma caproni]
MAFAVPVGRHARSRLIARQKYDKFSCVDEILLGRDLRGQFMVISAAGCGLPLRMASKLAAAGATVIAACPFCPPGAHPCPSDRSQIGPGLWWISCDLGDLTSVARFGQVLFGCLVKTDCEQSTRTEAVRIILLSEEMHRNIPLEGFWCATVIPSNIPNNRANLPTLDASIHSFPRQFTHIPTDLMTWLDQYRWSKLFQLLYLFELQRRLTAWHVSIQPETGRIPIVCACSQGSPLPGQCSPRWNAIQAPLWIRALLYSSWLTGSDQLAATPILCAVDDSLNSWKLSETEPRLRIPRALRTVLYIHQCRPRSTLLTRYEPSRLLEASRALWNAVETALSSYAQDKSIWVEFANGDV